jgi:F-type H+-transporting ATPase subunit delta
VAAIDPAARRYAQAAFELAQESGEPRAWAMALNTIADFMSQADVLRVLTNTRITMDKKLAVVDAVLAELPPLPLNLARLVVRKGRSELAPQIAEQFRIMLEESEGVARARATSAIPLSEDEKAAIVRRLGDSTGRQILLETEVDPSILGGLVIQVGDRLVDASTRARLDALRENLVGAIG